MNKKFKTSQMNCKKSKMKSALMSMIKAGKKTLIITIQRFLI